MLDFIADKSFHIVPRFIASCTLPFFSYGRAGVVIFFLVSGYIITHVIQSERPGEFIIKRIFRIYPLYICAVLMETVVGFYSESNIPHLTTLILQLLLIGDFFGTPLALGNVECTLRIEIMFYLFMGVLRGLNLTDAYKKALPWILISSTILLGLLSPTLSPTIYLSGFFATFSPFLLLGSFFYLKEAKQVNFVTLFGFGLMVMCQYYYLFSIYQPVAMGKYPAAFAITIFFLLWRYQSRLSLTPAVRFVSDLAYPVYLFHYWGWEPIKKVLSQFPIPRVHLDIQVIFVLLVICYSLSKLIEKPGINLGRTVLKWYREK